MAGTSEELSGAQHGPGLGTQLPTLHGHVTVVLTRTGLDLWTVNAEHWDLGKQAALPITSVGLISKAGRTMGSPVTFHWGISMEKLP